MTMMDNSLVGSIINIRRQHIKKKVSMSSISLVGKGSVVVGWFASTHGLSSIRSIFSPTFVFPFKIYFFGVSLFC